MLIHKIDNLFNSLNVSESHSHSKCMECDKPPTVEVLWAEGMGHAWFCDKCFADWKTKDGKGDICGVKPITDGKAAKKYADNKNKKIDEARMDALLRETPKKTHARSNDITDIKVMYDNVYKNGRLMRFEVKGTTGNIYHPSIYFAEKYNLNSDVRCRCSCPAFKWWGSGYNARNEGYRLRQTSGEQIEPNVRDPARENKLCKHLIAVFEEVPRLAEKWTQKEFGFAKETEPQYTKGKQKQFPFMRKKPSKQKQLKFEFGK